MGFFKDVSDLRAAIKANVEAGRGKRSLVEAVEQMTEQPKREPPKPTRKLGRTFLLSALVGAMWQGSRGRRP